MKIFMLAGRLNETASCQILTNVTKQANFDPTLLPVLVSLSCLFTAGCDSTRLDSTRLVSHILYHLSCGFQFADPILKGDIKHNQSSVGCVCVCVCVCSVSVWLSERERAAELSGRCRQKSRLTVRLLVQQRMYSVGEWRLLRIIGWFSWVLSQRRYDDQVAIPPMSRQKYLCRKWAGQKYLVQVSRAVTCSGQAAFYVVLWIWDFVLLEKGKSNSALSCTVSSMTFPSICESLL